MDERSCAGAAAIQVMRWNNRTGTRTEESTDVRIGLTGAAKDRQVHTMRKKGTTNGYSCGTTCFQD
ncbi:MAG: hypothetical protein WA419_13250 [Silvibacterium sp.]